MRLQVLALSIAIVLGCSAAFGAEPTEKALPLGGADKTVELPMLVAPVSVDGRLYHYAYMRVLLDAKDMDVAAKARDKVPFILDALLRETHRESIALDGDPKTIDGDRLKARLLGAANAVMGAGSFLSVTFRDTIQTDDPNQEIVPPPEETASAAQPKAGGH